MVLGLVGLDPLYSGVTFTRAFPELLSLICRARFSLVSGIAETLIFPQS